MLSKLLARLRALAVWRTLDRDIDDEIDAHLAREADQLVARGASPHDARMEARRQFRNRALVREQALEAYGWRWLPELIQDVRYSVRALARAPGFTGVAVLSLGLAIGANATIFSAINALLLRRLPVAAPDRLVTIEQQARGGELAANLALPDIERFQRLPAFSGVTAVTWADAFNVAAPAALAPVDPGQLRISIVTGSFFDVLGLRPQRGRLLTTADDEDENGPPVAVVSDAYWSRRFGRAPGALGSTLAILGTTYTIVGVAPPAFRGDWVGWPTDIWVPVAVANRVFGNPAGSPRGGRHQFKALARLSEEVSVATAQAAARVERDRIVREHPDDSGLMSDRTLVLSQAATGYSSQRAEFRRPLMMLMGIVGALWLVACANVGGLLLARGIAREPEMAVRAALGGRSLRLVRQLLTETAILAVAGAGVGIAIAEVGTAAAASVVASGPVTSVQWGAESLVLDLTPDHSVLLFTSLLCVLATLACGLVPALLGAGAAARVSLIGRLIGTRTTAQGARWRRWLLVGQIAIMLTLVGSAAVLVRSIRQLHSTSTGFDRDRLLLAWLLPGYAGASTPDIARHVAQIQQRLAREPGVVSVSATVAGVFGASSGTGSRIRVEGAPDAEAIDSDDSRFVGPGFFETTGQRLVEGRDFRDTDTASSPRVLIVDRSLARRVFGSGASVGRRVSLGSASSTYEVVGVVDDATYDLPRAAPGMTLYLPFAQARNLRRVCMVVRTAGNPAEAAPRVRQALASFDPLLPVLDVNTTSGQLDRVLFREQLVVSIASAVGGIAFVLACLGVYGMASFHAGRRSREVGLLVALGARTSDVVRVVARETLTVVLLGTVIGSAAAALAARTLISQLNGFDGGVPVTLLVVVAAIAAVTTVAAALPAVRVARRPPVHALREN